MDLAHKLLALTTTLLLALGAFFAYTWIRSHDDYIRAEAQVKTDQSALSQLARQQSDLAAQLKPNSNRSSASCKNNTPKRNHQSN
jgi:hypothetical protein